MQGRKVSFFNSFWSALYNAKDGIYWKVMLHSVLIKSET